jgi:hypothetical protein
LQDEYFSINFEFYSHDAVFFHKRRIAHLTRALTLLTSGGDKPMWTIAAKISVSP